MKHAGRMDDYVHLAHVEPRPNGYHEAVCRCGWTCDTYRRTAKRALIDAGRHLQETMEPEPDPPPELPGQQALEV